MNSQTLGLLDLRMELYILIQSKQCWMNKDVPDATYCMVTRFVALKYQLELFGLLCTYILVSINVQYMNVFIVMLEIFKTIFKSGQEKNVKY